MLFIKNRDIQLILNLKKMHDPLFRSLWYTCFNFILCLWFPGSSLFLCCPRNAQSSYFNFLIFFVLKLSLLSTLWEMSGYWLPLFFSDATPEVNISLIIVVQSSLSLAFQTQTLLFY